MTALAEILKSEGAEITGSDTAEKFHTDAVLKHLGIRPLKFSASNIKRGLDLIIYSSAYPKNHSERQRAKKLRIPQMSYAEALSKIFNQKMGIMVAGSHGKTTTTAVLGQILIEAGFDPTIIVGGTVINWGKNARIGKSNWMLIEGDEYQEKFLNFRPLYLLITNIDYDHPDTYPDKKSYRRAFEKLIRQTRKKVFNAETLKPLSRKVLDKFKSKYLLGEHNKKNMRLALALSQELGISDKKIKAAMTKFKGIKRRMEIYLRRKNIIVMDDYAHHPAEISATLEALKSHWPRHKITVIFQPHTFSRTGALLSDFAKAFRRADNVYLVPTYSSAREKNQKGTDTDEKLYEKIKKNNKNCFRGLPSEKMLAGGKGKRLIVTMGAGDLWRFAEKVSVLIKRKR